MGQEEIGEILRKIAPELMTFDEILDASTFGRVSVTRSLKAFRKRPECNYVIRPTDDKHINWIQLYGIKEEK
jgi:hypothetical protein